MILICDVYKSSKTLDLYLYVDRKEGFERVPEALLDKFGEPKLSLSFTLNEERKLAREDPKKVMAAIKDSGFYLQLPPQKYPRSVG
tara:strand:+ start:597 stop:854 length:258 start_codon:yes stop_codon:yes gene_type:complete